MIFDPKTDFPLAKDVSKNQNSINMIELDGQKYLFALFLDNGKQKIQIPHKYLNFLKIEDSLIQFRTEGYVTYRDPNFSIGRLFSKLNAILGDDCIEENSNTDEVTDFAFRGSGGERIHIKLMPLADDQDNDIIDLSQKYQNGEWVIKKTFIITNIKNESSPLRSKQFKIEFEDVTTYIMNNFRIARFPISTIGRQDLNAPTPLTRKERENRFGGRENLELQRLLAETDSDEVNTPEIPNIRREVVSGNVINKTNYPRSLDEAKNTYQAAKTGEAIYWILYKAFEDYEIKTGFPVKNLLPEIKFNGTDFELESSELSNKKKSRIRKSSGYDVKVLDKEPEDVWDFGPSDSILFTSINASGNTMTLLDKFLKLHVSGREHEESDFLDPSKKSLANLNWGPCLLHEQRGENETSENKITLRPIFSWLSNMGSLDGEIIGDEFMETFQFKNEEDYIDKSLGVVKGFLADVNICNDVDGKIEVNSNAIENHIYEPMEPQDSAKFIVPHIVEHDFSRKNIIAETDGSFRFCKKFISELYIPFFTKKTDERVRYGMVNIDDDLTIKDNDAKIRIKNQIPTKPSFAALGRNNLIKNMIFMNDLLSFRTKGSTHRQSGRFFSVDLLDGSDKNDENLNRLLGSWWATNVTHEIDFGSKSYNNELTGVKFYRFKSIISDEENELLDREIEEASQERTPQNQENLDPERFRESLREAINRFRSNN